MRETKRQILRDVVPLIIFAFLVIGYVLAVPTIGPGTITDFDGIEVDWIELGGANITSWTSSYDQNLSSVDDVIFNDINITGKQLLGTQLDIQTELNTQYEWSGSSVDILAGEAITQGNLVYLNSTGYVFKTDADAAATMPCIGLALKTKNAGELCPILMQGWVRNSNWAWIGGDEVFASTTPGGKTQTAPSGSGDQVQVIGIALDEDVIYINPDYTVMEIS